MPAVLISVVNAQSNAGYPVIINGIDPTDTDCIVGEIVTPGQGRIDAKWDLNGTMRGGTHECNLNMTLNDLAEVKELAQKLGAV